MRELNVPKARLLSGRDVDLHKTPVFLNFLSCLSRACLGKVNVLIQEWLKRRVSEFRTTCAGLGIEAIFGSFQEALQPVAQGSRVPQDIGPLKPLQLPPPPATATAVFFVPSEVM